jgi:hypothetical protein
MPNQEEPATQRTVWTPAPPFRQMTVVIEIGPIGNSDLISSKIRVGRYQWRINFNVGGPAALIQSMHDFHIPDNSSDPAYKNAVKELERAVAYMRAAVTFAFETPH